MAPRRHERVSFNNIPALPPPPTKKRKKDGIYSWRTLITEALPSGEKMLPFNEASRAEKTSEQRVSLDGEGGGLTLFLEIA